MNNTVDLANKFALIKYLHKITVYGEPVEPPFDKLRANGKYKQTIYASK